MNPGILTPPTQFATMPRGLLGRPTPVPMIGMREFLPTQIAGLDGWWDAADDSTVALSGGLVSVWADKSGNGRAASQPDSSLRPAYNATQNRRRALNWTGGLRQLSLPPVSYSSGTLFVVADDKNGVGNTWLSLSGSNSSFLMSGFNADNGWEFGYGANAKSPGWSGGVVSICAAEFGSGTSRLFLNGVGGASTPTSPAVAIDQFGRYARQLGYAAGGACCEIIFYNRRLSAGERQQVEGYLSEKWGIPLASRGPQSSDADAQDWITRVYLNGGTVSTSTALAVSSFCSAINAAGIRDRFYRLNLFCGDQLAACLVPLYRGPTASSQLGGVTDTNTNFVSADYRERGASGGISKSTTGATKSLNTGLAPTAFPATATVHMSFSHIANSIVGSGFNVATPEQNAGNYQFFGYVQGGSFATNAGLAQTSGELATSLSPYSRWIFSRTSPTLLTAYRNGSSAGTSTAAQGAIAPTANAVVLIPQPSAAFGFHYYSIGNGLTESQASALDAAYANFLTALGRA